MTTGPDRFDLTGAERTMWAVVTTGNGGFDRLVYRRVPVPRPGPGEVLVRVLAAGVNNTEINTRIGWYSASVKGGTEAAAAAEEAAPSTKADGGWDAPTPFPFIQGTDCCGRVLEAGSGVEAGLLGRRVLVRPCMRTRGFGSLDNVWLASDFDGAFAQLVKVPAGEVFPVECDWSDAELGSMPCAYGTAENLLHRARVSAGERVLVTGASGGVGSAAVQLARRRGAHVTALAGADKQAAVAALGAGRVLGREADLLASLGRGSIEVAIDCVGGPGFGAVVDVLCRGGRYATSGAIGGPLVELDMRRLYLKDLTLLGATAWDEPVFPNLIGYIERGEIRPAVARTFPLAEIAEAQREFLRKTHVGKIVLIPPAWPDGSGG